MNKAFQYMVSQQYSLRKAQQIIKDFVKLETIPDTKSLVDKEKLEKQ